MKNLCLLLLLVCSSCALSTQECPDGFMPAKQTVVTPSGIVTQPNEYGQLPPGTLRVGNNICIRKTGVVEPRPAFTDLSQVGTGAAAVTGVVKLWPLAADKILALVRDGGSYVLRAAYTDGTEASFSGFGNGFSPGKIQITRSRDRTIVVQNTLAPQIIADSDLGSTGGTKTSRRAGLPMPSLVRILFQFPGVSVSDTKFVSYRAVFRKKEGSYVIQGAASPATHFQNSSGGISSPTLSVYWDKANSPLLAGDFLDVYRTEEKTDEGLVDDRHRFAFTYVITSTDISNGRAVFLDSCGVNGLGADLYSNSSQEGAAKNNYMPPPSTDVITFKGATFYNATSAWHTRSINAPYLWGPLATSEELVSGIGSRSISSTTNGTTTVTMGATSGLAVGQHVQGSGMPANTKIVTVGVGSITLNNAATNSATANRTFIDVIELDGTEVEASTWLQFLQALATANAAGTVAVVGVPASAISASGLTAFDTSIVLTLPVSATGPFTIRASNGANYSPPLPTMSATAEISSADARTNRLFFSKIGQPEAVSPDSFFFVRNGTLLRMWTSEESLFVACTDGISRIVGDGDDWSVVPVDEDTILLAPDAVDTMDNTAYALTTAGFVSISEAGVQKISGPLVGDDFRALWKQFQGYTPALPFTWGIQVAADKYRNEVWVNFSNLGASGTPAFVNTYIWNTETNTFTTQSTEQSVAVAYIPFLQSIVLGQPLVSGLKLQLRKYSATDYMTASFEFNPVFGDDVGYLKQWIDVTLLFQLLQAVTIKPAFERVDYPAAYALSAGDNVEEVCAVLQDYAYNKHCRFGATITPILASKHWTLLGLAFRYRLAAETLRA